MKKYIFLAASALTLASCTSEDFLGNTPGNVQSNTSAINFDGGTGKITRATLEGDKAAKALNNNYVVYGYKTYKTAQDKSTTTVFDHYTIHWNNQAGKTESNTCGWEYVGQKANSLSELPGDKDQTIKYWDYSASQYDFVAFSFGSATQGTEENQVEASKVTTSPQPSYTLKGDVKNLAKCFIADRITATPNLETTNKKANLHVGYKDNVQFNFRSLSTKVTMGIYETIPGYSVKDVKFYSADNTKATDNKPTLYAANATIPSGKGTISVTFPTTDEENTDYNKAHVEFAAATGSDNSSSIQFGNLSTVEKEKEEKGTTGFIGRDITTFSIPKDGTNKKYEVVIPAKVGALTLKVDYTLESIDGSGETIKVTGATAVVPEKYTNWEPNYAYTYIFKISDKTNGSTGTPDTNPAGLYPITFDAIVTETETGKQETITTVDKNSITTYAKGEINNEYKTKDNIYVSVAGKTLTIDDAETTNTNVKLYTAKATGTQTITEATVAHCLKSGEDVVGGGKKLTNGDTNVLTVTPATTTLSIVDKIESKDAVDGNEISGNFAKFTPENAGTYVFEFTDNDNNKTKYYKVIIVK
ncbi:hypothetical protein [Segatella copri]|uniref:hypothetical protein n=1 Tax=Segatella copri TaxID=165179 RepID=UPI001F483D5E|nr:hypothetical protein [Segatella copri]